MDETVIINIIVCAGEANSYLQQAFLETSTGDFNVVEELLTKANESLEKAHQAQTELLQAEARGEQAEISLLMVHAQDHLMNVMLSKQLIIHLISMQKEINELRGKLL
ncbi:MAG: hypothetical protein ATN36_06425 [Epulopiscium sp. Nele67-Bin005]|nr:MAG: hypothetical protein ATN36_06425 [Epulopiscium sp. Nele67-Bin005]